MDLLKRILFVMMIPVCLQAQDTVYVLIYGNTNIISGHLKLDSLREYSSGGNINFFSTIKLRQADSAGNRPPLLFTSGNQLTATPQVFSLEPKGDSLYFTGESGVRKALAVAITDTSTAVDSTGGGWTRKTSIGIYSTNPADKVFIRSTYADTTGTKLLNVYGTSKFYNNLDVNGNVHFTVNDTASMDVYRDSIAFRTAGKLAVKMRLGTSYGTQTAFNSDSYLNVLTIGVDSGFGGVSVWNKKGTSSDLARFDFITGAGATMRGLFYANDTAFVMWGFPKNVYVNSIGNVFLASDASNFSSKVMIGSASSPSAMLHVVSSTEQFRLAYNTGVYSAFTVSSAGNLAIVPTRSVSIGTTTAPDSQLTVNLGGHFRRGLKVDGLIAATNIASMAAADSQKYHGSYSINTVGKTLTIGPLDGGVASKVQMYDPSTDFLGVLTVAELDAAKTWTLGNTTGTLMVGANNLSEITVALTARTNLGLNKAVLDSSTYHGSYSINTAGKTLTLGSLDGGNASKLQFYDTSTDYLGILTTVNQNAINTWSLPDATGTIALTTGTTFTTGSTWQGNSIAVAYLTVGTMASADSQKYHGSYSINTVGKTLTLGPLDGGGASNLQFYDPSTDYLGELKAVDQTASHYWSLPNATGVLLLDVDTTTMLLGKTRASEIYQTKFIVGTMASADSQKYHGSFSINTVGKTLTLGSLDGGNASALQLYDPSTNYLGILTPLTQTGIHTWSLPDETGTLALVANVVRWRGERKTVTSPVSGDMYYNTDDLKIYVYTNDGWIALN